ncbi:MAG: PDZ domain-containing protein [Planctomycetota bacterium]|nr:MAG: PDZ domain-containing protein [Planctomycetota bacterium]
MKQSFVSLLFALAFLLLAASLPAQSEAAGQDKKVEVATLGMTTRAPSKQEIERHELPVLTRVQGQVIAKLDEGGVTALAGLRVGDVVFKVEKSGVLSQDDLSDFLRVRKPGQSVRIELVRAADSAHESVELKLGKKLVKAPDRPQLRWQYAGLSDLATALSVAEEKGQLVMVGLSGAET